MNLEFKIAKQYIRSKKNGSISLFSGISIIGLALGVMTLVTVLSVMNGFHSELRDRVLSSISHSYIAERGDYLKEWEFVSDRIEENKEVIASSPYIEKYGLLTYRGESAAVNVRGIIENRESQTSDVLNKITYGSLDLSKSNILIGIGLSETLRVSIGDKITLITPKMKVSIMGITPRSKRFTISGIFDAGMNQYDNNLAFIELGNAQKLFGIKDGVSGIRIKFKDLFEAKPITREIVTELGRENYYGVDWTTQKANFIKALELEKQMIGVILSLIIAVAAFNIVSMMIMVVTDKKGDIAILRTMGMKSKRIVRVFFYQGMIIGLTGIIIGIVLGVILSLNLEALVSLIEYVFRIEIFSKEVFYITRFPTDIHIADIVKIAIGSILLVIFSSIYPAKKAGKVEIAKVLNNE
jgi:lipoprotein-releasing system permease protein